jgi:hypothetical protein
VIVLVLLVVAAISWHFSDAVLVPDHSSPAAEVEVEQVRPGRIFLERSEDTERPGTYGLEWPGGHAIAGDVVEVDADTVTRRLRAVRGYLVPGMDVGVEADVYVGDPGQALDIPFAEVDVPGHLLPGAECRPRRVLERRPPTLRTSPDRIPLTSAGLNMARTTAVTIIARASKARRSRTARSTTAEATRAPTTCSRLRGMELVGLEPTTS